MGATCLAVSLLMVDATPTVTCTLLGLWYGFCAGSFFLLVGFHLYLNFIGMTTWENLQMGRRPPAYFVDAETGKFSNPYNKGFVRNLCARIGPSTCGQETKHDDIP